MTPIDTPYLIRRAGRWYPDSTLVDDGVRSISLGSAVARAERVANALDELGLPDGAPVGVLSENRSEYVEADLAIALGRRVRVALNARLHLDDHRLVAGDAGMRALFFSRRHAEQAEALAAEFELLAICLDDDRTVTETTLEGLVGQGRGATVVRPGCAEDAACITYTSGTTGRPKGIVLSHRSLREVAANLLLEFGPVAPGELIVLPQALSHGAGYWVLPWLVSGAGVYAMRQFDPDETYRVSERPNVRTFKCVPAMLPPLLEQPPGRRLGYETVIYGASPISAPVLEASLDRWGPVLEQIYGQSEAPMTITCLHKDDHLGDGSARFSAGRAFRSVAVEVRGEDGRILPPGEAGEVVVSGAHLMTGYLGLPEETEAVLRDGWVMTKDIGVIDEQGFLTLQGRRDEIIISGGYNISPREVEGVLVGFAGVAEAAVIGLPDERWGSAVSAAVRLAPGASGTPEDLIARAKERLGFRAPKRITILEEIPRNPYGKVDRARLLTALTSTTEADR